MMNLLARLRDRLRRSQLIFNEGGRPQGPPDLDELWRDFNRKLSGLLSGKGGRGGGSNDGPGSSGGG
ncbi:MAG: FtsH protease modulator HflK, partial [Pseudomonadota bacterium]